MQVLVGPALPEEDTPFPSWLQRRVRWEWRCKYPPPPTPECCSPSTWAAPKT